MPEFALTDGDLLAIGGYLVFITGLGIFLARRLDTPEEYFLAGRSLTGWLIGLSLFASNMSSSTLIGLPGSAYDTGIAVFNYEWMAAVILVFFAVFLAPFYLRSKVFTLPEFLERRFDARPRYYVAALTILLNIIVDTAGALYAGGLVMQLLFPAVPLWQPVLALALLAGVYTLAGGLKAVVYTDALQAVLLLVGAAIIALLAYQGIESWQAVRAATPPAMLSLIRPVDDAVLPWPGLITGVLLIGFYFWCANQFMVQRVLGARDLDHARGGLLLAGFLKLPVLFIMVLPGTMARVLYPDLNNADRVFPTLMLDLLPPGFRGIILVALLAAIMSSIDSTLNSASTLVTMDFIRKRRPAATNRTLVISGRVVTLIFMLLAAAWAPVILRFPNLWSYLQSVLAYASPPVAVCFIAGIFWPRATASGALAALLAGHSAALILFFLQWSGSVVALHFLYVPVVVLAVSVPTMILVSLLTPAPDRDSVEAYTWSPAVWVSEAQSFKGIAWHRDYRLYAALLIALTAGLVVWFR